MNILKHSIYKAIYELCLEIEKLPPSEQQTKVIVMAGNFEKHADALVDALRDAISTYGPKPEIVVTEERVEAWKAAAEVA